MIAFRFILNACIATSLTNHALAEPFAIFSMNLDGTDLRCVASDPNLNYGSVDVSPCGKRLAFDSWPNPYKEAEQWIWTCTARGTDIAKVLRGGMPKWSPDGKRIAYQDFSRGVTICEPDGKAQEHVVKDAANPYWVGQESDKLACLDWGRNIYLLNLRTGSRTILLPPTRYWLNHGYAFSSDGSRVCYTRGLNQTIQLVVLRIDDPTSKPQVLYSGRIENGVAWQPNGNVIAMSLGSANEPKKLHLFDLADKSMKEIPNQQRGNSYVNPRFSPDGRRIYFSSDAR